MGIYKDKICWFSSNGGVKNMKIFEIIIIFLIIFGVFLSGCYEKEAVDNTILTINDKDVTLTIHFENNKTTFNKTDLMLLNATIKNISNNTISMSEWFGSCGVNILVYLNKNNTTYCGASPAYVFKKNDGFLLKPNEQISHCSYRYNIANYSYNRIVNNITAELFNFPLKGNYSIWIVYWDNKYGEQITSNILNITITE